MRVDSAGQITQLLRFWSNDSQAALEKLTSLVYGDFHSLAKGTMRGERERHIQLTTALIHEVFVRLIDWESVSWQNRVSARLMRRILVKETEEVHLPPKGATRCQSSSEGFKGGIGHPLTTSRGIVGLRIIINDHGSSTLEGN